MDKPTFTSKRLFSEITALLRLTTPLIISQLAQMGMNFTDTVMAGRHSNTSLAGVAIGSSIWVPCFLFLVGLLMATTPLVAQAWGGKRFDDIRVNVQQSLWLALVSGIVMTFILQQLGNTFEWMAMEQTTRRQAQGYVYAVSFGLPALALFQVFRGLNEGTHLTRPFMYVSLVALLVNIPLNYIFIYGKLGLPEMGGAGCGWATALVLWLEALLMLLFSLHNGKKLSINWHKNWQAPLGANIAALLKLGVPIGIALLIESSMFALIALFLANQGSEVVAGHQVAMSVISILFMVPLSLAMGLTIRCGYYLGSGEPLNARFAAVTGIGLTLLIAACYSLLILVFAESIASLYTTHDAVKILAVKLLFLAAIFQFSDSLQVTAAGVLRGYKDTKFAFFVVLLAYWIIGLPMGYTLGLTDFWGVHYGAQGFWMGLIAGLGMASLLLAGRVIKLSHQFIREPGSVSSAG